MYFIKKKTRLKANGFNICLFVSYKFLVIYYYFITINYYYLMMIDQGYVFCTVYI